ncbi:MAG: Fur family transcriptional regulator [Prolixibacteraceae bacterium]|jgi:Fur family ferric uptake transcriptional regulator|nr:transcriptional repressor [Prolixibacteraceae bacterium]
MGKQELTSFLEDHNVRPTSVRLMVLDCFWRKSEALSLTDLEVIFEDTDRSTLFRTIKLFLQKDLIHEIDALGKQTKYALCDLECDHMHEHIHFTCRICHRAYCFSDISIPKLALPEGFVADHQEYVVMGRCPECLEK